MASRGSRPDQWDTVSFGAPSFASGTSTFPSQTPPRLLVPSGTSTPTSSRTPSASYPPYPASFNTSAVSTSVSRQASTSALIPFVPHKLNHAPARRRRTRDAEEKGAPPRSPQKLLGLDVTVLRGHRGERTRWPKYKWTLLVSVITELVMGLSVLILCLLVWFDALRNAHVLVIANRQPLIIATAASTFVSLCGVLGIAGVLLNNRAFLALYTLALWVGLALIAAVGYITYRFRAFNLRGKLSEAWSRDYALLDRLQIQNSLSCCGFNDPFTEAILSQLCFSRTVEQDGCLGPFLRYERATLLTMYSTAFSLVALQIILIAVALTSSNHITRTFGKGQTPRHYRKAIAAALAHAEGSVASGTYD